MEKLQGKGKKGFFRQGHAEIYPESGRVLFAWKYEPDTFTLLAYTFALSLFPIPLHK